MGLLKHNSKETTDSGPVDGLLHRNCRRQNLMFPLLAPQFCKTTFEYHLSTLISQLLNPLFVSHHGIPTWQELFEAEADLPQKAAPKRRLAAPKATDDDDDWGNDDLTDVLPPM